MPDDGMTPHVCFYCKKAIEGLDKLQMRELWKTQEDYDRRTRMVGYAHYDCAENNLTQGDVWVD